MNDEARVVVHAADYFGLEWGALTDSHLAAICFVFLNHENAPAVTSAKQRARWNFQNAIVFPNDDAAFDPIAVAECLSGFSKVLNGASTFKK